MKPYGEEPGSRARSDREERYTLMPGGFARKLNEAERQRMKRRPKKKARQAAKAEVREEW